MFFPGERVTAAAWFHDRAYVYVSSATDRRSTSGGDRRGRPDWHREVAEGAAGRRGG